MIPTPEETRETILVVDDTVANITVLSYMLSQQGYQVRSAQNGRQALRLLEDERCDLILLDVMMPEMDGYETCRRLKANPATREIPVIFITFLKEIKEKVKGFELGAIDYITKPFEQHEVLARVATHLTNRRLTQQLQEACARSRILADATSEGLLIHDLQQVFDVNRAIEVMSGHDRQSWLDASPLRLISPEWREQALRQVQEADGRPVYLEGQHRDGRRLFLEVRVSPMSFLGRSALLSAICDISQRVSLEQENLTLRATLNTQEQFGEMVGKSVVMRNVYAQVAKAAASDETILIYGETGTGKELAARTIFMLSKQHARELVTVNCGAIQDTLFESQFFGYRKGAFTGADRDTPGYFDRAHGGTLFLDEIGELPPTLQIKLLRVLEDRTYTPVGATTSRTADVRIIAATNQDLRNLRQTGRIREDFFQRLHVIAVHIPPLRHHKDDIPLLVRHFLSQSTPSANAMYTVPDGIVERFLAYAWPGNVRELFNELRRYLATGEIELNQQGNQSSQPMQHMPPAPTERPFYAIVEELERRLIATALAENKGNKLKTAEWLQIPLRTLHRKIKQYQL